MAILVAGVPAYFFGVEGVKTDGKRASNGLDYMHWAKTRLGREVQSRDEWTRKSESKRSMRVSLDDLEITDGGYGYAPIAARNRESVIESILVRLCQRREQPSRITSRWRR